MGPMPAEGSCLWSASFRNHVLDVQTTPRKPETSGSRWPVISLSPRKLMSSGALGWQVALGIPNEWHPRRAFFFCQRRLSEKYKTHPHTTSKVCVCVCVCVWRAKCQPCIWSCDPGWPVSRRIGWSLHHIWRSPAWMNPFVNLHPGPVLRLCKVPAPTLACLLPATMPPTQTHAPCPPSVLFSSAPTPSRGSENGGNGALMKRFRACS